MGHHLLHRGFGRVLSAKSMALLEDAVEDGADIFEPYHYAPDWIDTPEYEALDDDMLNQWDAICWNVWPPPAVGSMPLNIDLLREHGYTADRIAAALGLETPAVAGLMEQTEYPTAEQAQVLTEAIGASEPIELLSPVTDEGVLAQLSPRMKDKVLLVGQRLHLHEAEARNAIRAEFTLAARADNRDGRMRGAIDRLLAR
jgi:hypothetical protein